MEAKLDPLFQAATKEGDLPGIAASVLDSSGKALYSKAFGVNNLSASDSAPYTTSTPTLIWSCTKLVTSIAALQLVEQGKLSLDDLVEKYVPEINNIQVLDPSSKDAEGNLTLRPMKTKPTVLQLMTHTVGFTYDFFDNDTLTWQIQNQRTPAAYLGIGSFDCLATPLCADPGEKYNYGVNVDWLGFIVEAISGMPLNQYIEQNITKPLGMKNTSGHFPEGKDRMAVHLRDGEGKLLGNLDMKPADAPEKYGGGHYLVSTLDDYSQILITVLNKGTHPTSNTKILEAKTVDEHLFQDYVPQATKNSSNPAAAAADIGKVPSSIPQVTSTGQFLPGTKLGWSCGLMLNLEDVKGGRKKGSGAWAGLGNVYYWIDPTAGVTGLIMTSVLPFFDPKVLELFSAVEGAAYGGEKVEGFSAP